MGQQDEVDRNYEAFLELLPSILGAHRDKFALMKDRKIVAYFSTSEDARVAAQSFIADGLYSIQQVTDMAVNLGYFTNAVPIHPV